MLSIEFVIEPHLECNSVIHFIVLCKSLARVDLKNSCSRYTPLYSDRRKVGSTPCRKLYLYQSETSTNQVCVLASNVEK